MSALRGDKPLHHLFLIPLIGLACAALSVSPVVRAQTAAISDQQNLKMQTGAYSEATVSLQQLLSEAEQTTRKFALLDRAGRPRSKCHPKSPQCPIRRLCYSNSTSAARAHLLATRTVILRTSAWACLRTFPTQASLSSKEK